MVITSKFDRFLLSLGVVGIGVCSYLLFFYTPRLSIEGSSVIGQISPRGTIRRRVARSLHWENLTGPATLYLRDIIYAPKDATAEVILAGGKRIELLPDSMIQLDEVTSDAINITLIDGEVKGSDAEAVIVKKEVQFRMPAYPTRGIHSVAMASSITALELRHSELIHRMKEFLTPKRNRLVPKALSALKKPSPLDRLEHYVLELVLPTNQRYNLRANHWLEFVWTPIPLKGTRFVVELSRSPNFTSALTHATESTHFRLQIEEEGTYYWRVRSERFGDVRHSEKREFHMSLRSGLTKPVPIRIPSSKPTGFAVEIALDKKFKNITRILVVGEPACPRIGLKKGSYYCRVRRVGSDNVEKQYGFDIR